MMETESLFSVLRRTAKPVAVTAIETLVRSGIDHQLNRINVLDFARKRELDEADVIAAFLHSSRLGIFELSWNVLCPGCGGVLGANASLKGVNCDIYTCRLCAAGYEPTLDEMVEVAFTVSPRVHRVYDRAQTPYQRLRAAGVLSATKQEELEALYQRLNPLHLRRELDAALERLWTLAAPDPHRHDADPHVVPLPDTSPRRGRQGPGVGNPILI